MKNFRITAILLSVALLLIASLGVSAQSEETPVATEEMEAVDNTAADSPFYTGNGSAELASVDELLDPEAGSGFVRFAHVSPDSGPIDIYLNDLPTPLVTNLMLGEYTGAVRLPSGTHTFVARAAGSAADSEALTQFDWDLASNSTWLVMAVGTQEQASFLLEPLNVVRNITEDVARVRVANVNPYLTGLTVNVEGGDPLAQGIEWMGTSDVDLPAADASITITDAEGNAVAEPISVTFDPHMHYTVLLTSTGDQAAVTPLVIASPRDTTRVRFVSERADAVEILLMPIGEVLIPQLEAGSTTDYLTLGSEAATFGAYAPGTGPTGQNLAGVPVQLEPGYDLTVTFRADGSAEVTEKVFTDPMLMADSADDASGETGEDAAEDTEDAVATEEAG